jgi:hypothetical protein
MKRLASLLLVGLAGTGQAAGFENMLNPMGGLTSFGGSNPFAPNPFASNPFAPSPFGYGATPFGYGNPLGLGSPFGLGSPLGLGGMAAPLGLGLLNPLGGGMGNTMYPAMQMAPNMMSYQHFNQMANPYAGGPFAGNPYLQRSMPNPFSPPAFSPSMPSMPTLPFSVPQQQSGLAGLVPMPQQPQPSFFAYPMPSASSPAMAPQTPWSSAPAPAAPQPASVSQSVRPFFPLAPQTAQAPAQAKPAAPAQTQSATVAPAPMGAPLDPATFMQMFMKPAESTK